MDRQERVKNMHYVSEYKKDSHIEQPSAMWPLHLSI